MDDSDPEEFAETWHLAKPGGNTRVLRGTNNARFEEREPTDEEVQRFGHLAGVTEIVEDGESDTQEELVTDPTQLNPLKFKLSQIIDYFRAETTPGL